MELLHVLESTKGWTPIGGVRPTDWEDKIRETIDLISNKAKYSQHRHEFLVKEAMSTSDFPLMFGDVLDRSIIASYRAAPTVMRQIMQKGIRPDFKMANVFAANIGAGRLTEKTELAEYHETNVTESRYQYKLKEFGEKLLFSWQVLLADNLGAFNRIPQWFANMAMSTEEYMLTSLYFGAGGPLVGYFAAANGGVAISSLPLTIANLKTGITAMLKYKNKSGDAPIDNSPMYLMVGPGNEINALEITGTQTQTFSGGAAGVAYPVDSVLRKYNLKVVTNRMIPFIVTSGTIADTCWALFADPSKVPAGEVGFLAGHEVPDVFVKKSDLQRLGGGDASPLEGDFNNGSVGYLVRQCIGGATLDGRAGWASNGQ